MAKKISAEFDLPHQQIDRHWFAVNGHLAKSEKDKDEAREFIKQAVVKFIQQERWVSDGFYSSIQDILAVEADYVVVIELPLWRRLINHWQRIIKKQGRHPEVTPWQDFLHTFQIIKRTITFRPKLEDLKKKYAHKMILLKSHREIDTFFETLVKDHTIS